jgi:hypothetical protein
MTVIASVAKRSSVLTLTWPLTLTENAGFSPAFIYEAPKGLRLNMNLILKILKLLNLLKDLKRFTFYQPTPPPS